MTWRKYITHTIAFGNGVCNGVQPLVGVTQFIFCLNHENAKSAKYGKVIPGYSQLLI